jgi:hypothetical protein
MFSCGSRVDRGHDEATPLIFSQHRPLKLDKVVLRRVIYAVRKAYLFFDYWIAVLAWMTLWGGARRFYVTSENECHPSI